MRAAVIHKIIYQIKVIKACHGNTIKYNRYMMRNVFIKFIAICALFIFTLKCNAFELSELTQYSSMALKIFTVSDSMEISKRTIQGNKELDRVLGQKGVDFKTTYSYIGRQNYEVNSFTRWYYFFPKSWNGRGKGELKYEVNDVMKSGQPGDTVVIARKSDDEILLLIVKQGSAAEQELYSVLGMSAPAAKQTSLWRRLWGKSGKRTDDYEINTRALPMPAIPEKSWVRIYFTPGPDCENNIVASINNATHAIDVAVYSITNDKIVDALLRAHRRGVRVRVISDRLQAAGRSSLIARIRDAGIAVVLNKKHKIMHNKFAIFDKKDIETGSYNWTSSATKSNAENCMFFPEQNNEFSNQFKYLWEFYRG